MFISYPAIFFKNKDEAGFTVFFPDLQGCVTGGEDENESMHMAQDVLGAYLYEYFVTGKVFPKASLVSEIDLRVDDDDKDYLTEIGSFVSLVGLDIADYVKQVDKKTVKKTLTIPSYLNEMGKSMHINFSQVLTDALKSEFDLD